MINPAHSVTVFMNLHSHCTGFIITHCQSPAGCLGPSMSFYLGMHREAKYG